MAQHESEAIVFFEQRLMSYVSSSITGYGFIQIAITFFLGWCDTIQSFCNLYWDEQISDIMSPCKSSITITIMYKVKT